MSIGNVALLAGLAPRRAPLVIEAFTLHEPVAEGGLLTTKPRVSSAEYIHRMSDYLIGYR